METASILALGLMVRYLDKMLLTEATLPFLKFKPYSYFASKS
jgi:hypothetical protein